VGAWYWIGVSAGLGAAVGIVGAAVLGTAVRVAFLVGGLLAVLAGALLGLGIDEWQPGGWGDIALGAAGALAGLLGAAQTVKGALRRGGTRLGTVALVALTSFVVAAIAWIPAAGYLVALALLALAVLLRRARPQRYAGLRTLARDE
jgi:hypothetical protein